MIIQGIEPIGVTPKNPDYVMLAQSFGCKACKPDSIAMLASDLRAAFEYNGVTLIQVNQAITAQ